MAFLCVDVEQETGGFAQSSSLLGLQVSQRLVEETAVAQFTEGRTRAVAAHLSLVVVVACCRGDEDKEAVADLGF
jgi:hypothetical protein